MKKEKKDRTRLIFIEFVDFFVLEIFFTLVKEKVVLGLENVVAQSAITLASTVPKLPFVFFTVHKYAKLLWPRRNNIAKMAECSCNWHFIYCAPRGQRKFGRARVRLRRRR